MDSENLESFPSPGFANILRQIQISLAPPGNKETLAQTLIIFFFFPLKELRSGSRVEGDQVLLMERVGL